LVKLHNPLTSWDAIAEVKKAESAAVKINNAVANEWDIVIRKVNDAIRSDRAVRAGINSVLATQKQRIFSDGQDEKQSQIGQYSTKPISISKKNQVRQTGRTFFSGGYAEYKSAIGRNPGYVNLQHTSQMFQDYSFHVIGPNTYGLGFHNEFNFNKSQWMEKKYGKGIFRQSQQEGQILQRVIESELGKDFR
jgi:hypothetical protein